MQIKKRIITTIFATDIKSIPDTFYLERVDECSFDKNGNVSKLIQYKADESWGLYLWEFEYDNNNLKTTERTGYGNSFSINTLDSSRIITRDNYNRIIKTEFIDGSEIHHTYSENNIVTKTYCSTKLGSKQLLEIEFRDSDGRILKRKERYFRTKTKLFLGNGKRIKPNFNFIQWLTGWRITKFNNSIKVEQEVDLYGNILSDGNSKNGFYITQKFNEDNLMTERKEFRDGKLLRIYNHEHNIISKNAREEVVYRNDQFSYKTITTEYFY